MNALRHLLFVSALLFAAPALAQNGTEPIVATDLFKLKQLGNVAVAPGGRYVAYTVTSIEDVGEEGTPEYEYRTHIYLASSDGREPPHPLTRGGASSSAPAWDPTGDRLAFVRAVEGKPQIFILSMFGGEPFQLTRAEHGATAPRWSPDGDRILFTSEIPEKAVREEVTGGPSWTDERPGRSPNDTRGAQADPAGSLSDIRAWLDQNASDGSPRVLTRLNFQDELDLATAPTYDHLFVIEVREGAEPKAITRGFHSYGGGAWLPDGEQIVYSGSAAADRHPDRIHDTELFIAAADGSRSRRLLDAEGYAVSNPIVSPNGSTLAFLGEPLDDLGYGQTEIGVIDLREGARPEWLTLNFDRSVADPKWSKTGWDLYFTAPSNGGFPLYRLRVFEAPEAATPAAADTLAVAADSITISVDTAAIAEADVPPTEPGNRIHQLTTFDRGIRSYDVSTATLFYVLTDIANPYELYAANQAFTQERRLTSHNADWLKTKRISVPERRTLTRDSLTVEYWLTRPAFAESGRRYPLLLYIHGGPAAMWGPGEATMWLEFQFYASRGYGLVYSNPRGSGGYGYDFQRSNYRNWGGGPAGDVLAAASEAARAPWVDPGRQAVAGGSYGGYLTTWVIAHDDRFKAAVAQRGVYDLPTFLGEGNAWRLVPEHFGGYPWEDEVDSTLTAISAARTAATLGDTEEPVTLALATASLVPGSAVLTDSTESDSVVAAPSERPLSAFEVLRRESPLTYVDQIRTPLLIIHGDRDLRTGVSQSEMLYKSLKILDRPVEYARYPGAGHELTRSGDPKQRLDHLLRTYEFIARYVE